MFFDRNIDQYFRSYDTLKLKKEKKKCVRHFTKYSLIQQNKVLYYLNTKFLRQNLMLFTKMLMIFYIIKTFKKRKKNTYFSPIFNFKQYF